MSANDELRETIRKVETAASDFITGDAASFKKCFSKADDATIFGGLGAYEIGWAEIEPRLEWAAGRFAEGWVAYEPLAMGESGDLGYAIGIERGEAMICRVALHEKTPGSVASEEARGFRTWMKNQPGFVGGYHAQDSETGRLPIKTGSRESGKTCDRNPATWTHPSEFGESQSSGKAKTSRKSESRMSPTPHSPLPTPGLSGRPGRSLDGEPRNVRRGRGILATRPS